ncbi:hypothetical protein [Pedobacter aquatilis]|uniref:hypothetical protein n=1 Tax=Pedobacter aquatilis TaxID=351343 RepID=UPI00293095FA|nr:hypothetical protein [Pedobacter aquatilis]
MKKLIFVLVLMISFYASNAQYVEPEKAEKEAIKRKATEIITYSSVKFDSVQTRAALAEGTNTIVGVAFTRPRSTYGANNPPRKIFAAKVTIRLFPVTAYFEDYYRLWKDKNLNNPKKNKYVFLVDRAARMRLEAITNSDGEFTFPKMKPGKYYLWTSLDYSLTYKGKEYAGSSNTAYGNIDYYKQTTYDRGYSDFLEAFVEVKADEQTVKVNLRN